MANDFSGFLPALPMVRIDAGGRAFVAGSRCASCGQTFPGERMACASCGRRDTLQSIELATKGTLYNYTIVHRSYPGVKVPFVAAIVDLEGGGSLRGTLLQVEPVPEKLPYDMPVDVVFRDTGQKDKEGRPFVSYFFVPAQGEAR
jgi:uncharacterized OB-fold protein